MGGLPKRTTLAYHASPSLPSSLESIASNNPPNRIGQNPWASTMIQGNQRLNMFVWGSPGMFSIHHKLIVLLFFLSTCSSSSLSLCYVGACNHGATYLLLPPILKALAQPCMLPRICFHLENPAKILMLRALVLMKSFLWIQLQNPHLPTEKQKQLCVAWPSEVPHTSGKSGSGVRFSSLKLEPCWNYSKTNQIRKMKRDSWDFIMLQIMFTYLWNIKLNIGYFDLGHIYNTN